MWAVDLGTWGILYPFAEADPDFLQRFFFNAFSYIEVRPAVFPLEPFAACCQFVDDGRGMCDEQNAVL